MIESQVQIRLANAPCSWGTLEFEGLGGEQVGYRQMLDELAAAGYVGTELGDWGYMPTDPDALHTELAARGLTMQGAFVPVALKEADAHAGGLAQALKVAHLLQAVAARQIAQQAPFLVLADDNGADARRTQHAGRITPAMGLSDEVWTIVAQGANRIARAVRDETGVRTVFHHHCAGYIETPDEIARFLDMTDPSLVGLVFDTGHYAYGAGPEGGAMVSDGLDRFADRIWYVHFKDCHPSIAQKAREARWDYFEAVRRGIFCELGQGCVDFPGVLQALRQRDYQGWIVVEQDVLPGMGAPRESAVRNRDYLRGLGL